MPTNWCRKKRARVGDSSSNQSAEVNFEELLEELEALRITQRVLQSPINAGETIDLSQGIDARRALVRTLWTGGYEESMLLLRQCNPELVAVLEGQVSSNYTAEDSARKDRYVDAMLLQIIRAQNQFKMPVLSAALTVMGQAHNVPGEFHDAVRKWYPGALATETWVVDKLFPIANECRPPPEYDNLGIAVTVFDNLMMKMNYGSYVVNSVGGTTKKMTNWLSCEIPKYLAPRHFDAERICMCAARNAAQLTFVAVSQGVAGCFARTCPSEAFVDSSTTPLRQLRSVSQHAGLST